MGVLASTVGPYMTEALASAIVMASTYTTVLRVLQAVGFAVWGAYFIVNARDVATRPKKRSQLYQPGRARWYRRLGALLLAVAAGNLGLLATGE